MFLTVDLSVSSPFFVYLHRAINIIDYGRKTIDIIRNKET